MDIVNKEEIEKTADECKQLAAEIESVRAAIMALKGPKQQLYGLSEESVNAPRYYKCLVEHPGVAHRRSPVYADKVPHCYTLLTARLLKYDVNHG